MTGSRKTGIALADKEDIGLEAMLSTDAGYQTFKVPVRRSCVASVGISTVTGWPFLPSSSTELRSSGRQHQPSKLIERAGGGLAKLALLRARILGPN